MQNRFQTVLSDEESKLKCFAFVQATRFETPSGWFRMVVLLLPFQFSFQIFLKAPKYGFNRVFMACAEDVVCTVYFALMKTTATTTLPYPLERMAAAVHDRTLQVAAASPMP
jgi:hypothetical protein